MVSKPQIVPGHSWGEVKKCLPLFFWRGGGDIKIFAKLSSSCSSSQIQLNWDSPIISLKPPHPPHPNQERYFQLTQEAEI